MSVMVSSESKPQHTFDSAEMGVIAHLYRGEVYRSTIWRTRLDNTTNWAIGHRAVDDLFQPAGFTPAPPARRTAHLPCFSAWRPGAIAISMSGARGLAGWR
jgi:Predicted integral membrane protein (DUF2270)